THRGDSFKEPTISFINEGAKNTFVLKPMTQSCPSGLARTASPRPNVPDAPGRFSTTTVQFALSFSFALSRRAMTAVPVPGVEGTISRMGLLGNASLADTPELTTRARSAVKRNKRLDMCLLLVRIDGCKTEFVQMAGAQGLQSGIGRQPNVEMSQQNVRNQLVANADAHDGDRPEIDDGSGALVGVVPPQT